jgi:hypothetical protein
LLEANWVEYSPKNWKGFRGHVVDCKVLFTPNTVQFFPADVFSKVKDDVYGTVLKRVEDAKKALEISHPGLVLGTPELVFRLEKQHLAVQYDPLSLLFRKANMRAKSDRLEIDASHGVPELETVGKQYAGEDLLKLFEMYDDVIKRGVSLGGMDSKLDRQSELIGKQIESMETFAVGMREHMKLIRMLQDVAEKQGQLLSRQEKLFRKKK